LTWTNAHPLRLQYHTESLTTFQNWPTQHTPLGHVTSAGWSPTSEYLAMGNSKGRVLLYRVKPYAGL
jgi:U3 small nucleolar RNA-associated protein 18